MRSRRSVLVLGEAEDRHDLRSGGDVEARLARDALERAAEADDGVSQGAVVHVDDPLPGDAPGVEPELVSEVEVVVEGPRREGCGPR